MSSRDEARAIDAFAREALGRHPGPEAELDRIVAAFVAETAAAQHRWEAAPPAPPRARAAARRDSTAVVVLGYATMIVAFFAAVTSASTVLPDGRFDVDPALAFPAGVGAACVLVVAAGLGALLPAWGDRDRRRETWQVAYALPVIVVMGLLVAVPRAEDDTAEVGAALWRWWLASNVVALVVTLLAAEARRRRAVTRPGEQVLVVEPEADVVWFGEIATHRARAVREVGALEARHRDAAVEVDRAWRGDLEAAGRAGQLSGPALAAARTGSAYRWVLERAAEPDRGG